MPKHLYVFSGLGADERALPHFKFDGYTTHFIQWIKPRPAEPLIAYTARLIPQIRQRHPILIGLSFGGIVAQEAARLIDTKKIILIASIQNKSELPVSYRLAGYLGLHRFIPASVLAHPGSIGHWLFGAESNAHKALLDKILSDTDPLFLKWALQAIVSWKNVKVSKMPIHIHGSADRILPVDQVKADYVIEGGGHLMTVTKVIEVKSLIAALLL